MFNRIFSPRKTVTIIYEGKEIAVEEGLSVAAAVLGAGDSRSRTSPPAAGKPETERGPYCNMGLCFECLMEIDGLPNRQACITPVREGMRVARQSGDPEYTRQRP